jgi:uncharacterized membrane protein YhaH (DUF805 family)
MAENDFINNFYEVATEQQASVEVENVSGFDYYKKCLQHYADFSGRTRRKEYWFFCLFNMLFAFTAVILARIIPFAIILYWLYVLAVFIPGLAVGVRRLHDCRQKWLVLSDCFNSDYRRNLVACFILH